MTFVSYAQNLEDYLLWRALQGVSAGSYIDIGSGDPAGRSVSRAFYGAGWRGVDVEPTLHHSMLMAEKRPGDLVVRAAVSSETVDSPFHTVHQTGFSTLSADLAELHRKAGRHVSTAIVPTITLDQIFALARPGDIHWLKIDVSGTEAAALQGWRESVRRPWLVVIAAIDAFGRNVDHSAWEPLLIEKDYAFSYFDGINRFYVWNGRADLREYFRYGVSQWDDVTVSQHVPTEFAETCRNDLEDVARDQEPPLGAVPVAVKSVLNLFAGAETLTEAARPELEVAENPSRIPRRSRPAAEVSSSGLVWDFIASADEHPDQAHVRKTLSAELARQGEIVRAGSDDEVGLRLSIEPARSHGIGYEDNIWILRDHRGGDAPVGMVCSSNFMAKAALDAGIAIPVTALGLGVDDWLSVVPAAVQLDARRFRFLCLLDQADTMRIDVLLESFFYVFEDADDVSLILAAPDRRVPELEDLVGEYARSASSPPHVVILPGTADPQRIKAIYSQCNALVSPHHSGGFNLPIARALLSGLPVIATEWGGHASYCGPETGWAIDFRYAKSGTISEHAAAPLAEPMTSSLDDLLLHVSRLPASELTERAAAGRRRLLSVFTWDKIAERLIAFGERCLARGRVGENSGRFAWLTTWNTRCGIADHASLMASAFRSRDQIVFAPTEKPVRADPAFCRRIWSSGKGDNHLDAVRRELALDAPRALIIQFNYGFFNHDQLSRLIDDCVAQGIVVIVEMHSTVDPGPWPGLRLHEVSAALSKCHRVIVHAVGDMERLKVLGVRDNLLLLPMGIVNHFRESRISDSREPTIATFGFCLPNKGLPEIVDAVGILKRQGRRVRLRMLNAEHQDPISKIEIRLVRDAIKRNDVAEDVEFITSYLESAECIRQLAQADLIVNPYQATGESASASVRTGLSAGVPVAVTPLPIFDDLGDIVFRLPGTLVEELADGIAHILDDIKNRSASAVRIEEAARRWIVAHDYKNVGQKLETIAWTLVANPLLPA